MLTLNKLMNTDRGKMVLIFMSETVCWTTEQLQFEIKQQKQRHRDWTVSDPREVKS